MVLLLQSKASDDYLSINKSPRAKGPSKPTTLQKALLSPLNLNLKFPQTQFTMTKEEDCPICADYEELGAIRGRHDRDCPGCQPRGSPNASDVDDFSEEEELVAREGGATVRRPRVDYGVARERGRDGLSETPVEKARGFFGLDDEEGELK